MLQANCISYLFNLLGGRTEEEINFILKYLETMEDLRGSNKDVALRRECATNEVQHNLRNHRKVNCIPFLVQETYDKFFKDASDSGDDKTDIKLYAGSIIYFWYRDFIEFGGIGFLRITEDCIKKIAT